MKTRKRKPIVWAVLQNNNGFVWIQKIDHQWFEYATNHRLLPENWIVWYDSKTKAVARATEIIERSKYLIKMSQDGLKRIQPTKRR